ncbi:hypothetical protein MBO12_01425 [Candidatus Saccharibacteria bacterium]|nr:hypothetical protein [Candidatus Saccharibacteria bacterium]
MANYTVIKIQFETLVTERTTSYNTRSATRVHYLQTDGTVASVRYDPGELKMVLDQHEGEQPYLTGDGVLHAHPEHLKDIQTSVIRYFK